MPFIVEANFIDVFKIGDNINYNLEILKVLYEGYERLPNGNKLIKPIIIINIAIAEALLYDFIENRIKKPNKSEKFFPEALYNIIKKKKFDKFEHYIIQAEKYDFFSLKDTNFYKAMHSLRKKRNRIHIQNSKWEKPVNENQIFDIKTKILSEKILEKIFTTLAIKYSRRPEYQKYVSDFHLPWNKHF